MKFEVAIFMLLSLLIYDHASFAIVLSRYTDVKQENDHLRVSCTDEVQQVLSWRGPNNKYLGANTEPEAVYSSRLGAVLNFKKIRREDAGTYTCASKTRTEKFTLFVEEPGKTTTDYTESQTSTEKHQSLSKRLSATTLAPPTTQAYLEFKNTNDVVTGREGDDIFVKCEIKGGIASWEVDGELPSEPKYTILENGLLIREATKEDSKIYICKAINVAAGDMINKNITVIVEYEPRLAPNETENFYYDPYMKKPTVYTPIGELIYLSCEVEAEPSPTFQWSLPNKEILFHVNSVSPYQSVLALNITSESYFGHYMCVARNKLGVLQVFFELKYGIPPDAPVKLELKDATNDTLTLEIEEAEEAENSTLETIVVIVEYRPEEVNGSYETNWTYQMFKVKDEKTYTLLELEPSTRYEVKAAAGNLAGLGEFTNTSIFETCGAKIYNFSNTGVILSILLLVFLNSLFDNRI